MLPRGGTRGGITEKAWQESVLKRDGYKCRICGAGEIPNYEEWYARRYPDGCLECGFIKHKGLSLHIHHIQPYSIFPKLAWNTDNGITLCEICHRKIKGREASNAIMLQNLIGLSISKAGIIDRRG